MSDTLLHLTNELLESLCTLLSAQTLIAKMRLSGFQLLNFCISDLITEHICLLQYMDELFLYGVDNACRNPDDDPEGPWCFVEEGWKEYCYIPFCRKFTDTIYIQSTFKSI